MSRNARYCQHCGEELDPEADHCPACKAKVGEPSASTSASTSGGERRSPAIAAILSLLLTGVGQIYLGRVARGVGFLVGGFAVIAAIVVTLPDASFLGYLVPVASAIDAYSLAGRLNRT